MYREGGVNSRHGKRKHYDCSRQVYAGSPPMMRVDDGDDDVNGDEAVPPAPCDHCSPTAEHSQAQQPITNQPIVNKEGE